MHSFDCSGHKKFGGMRKNALIFGSLWNLILVVVINVTFPGKKIAKFSGRRRWRNIKWAKSVFTGKTEICMKIHEKLALVWESQDWNGWFIRKRREAAPRNRWTGRILDPFFVKSSDEIVHIWNMSQFLKHFVFSSLSKMQISSIYLTTFEKALKRQLELVNGRRMN